MNLINAVKKVIPTSIKTRLGELIRNRQFQSVNKIECDASMLLSIDNVELTNIFKTEVPNSSWDRTQKAIGEFNIPDFTGGVNPGDRRAIFCLIKYFKPSSVLEIGTHIGASTVHIASALHQNQLKQKNKSILKTLDIRDVNSNLKKPWLQYGTKKSPVEMIRDLKYETFVEFMVGTSLNYLESTDDKFDFIFLDGDHSAKTVYKEIPLALKKLNKNGILLLHDYFPNGNPLWSNNYVINGPYFATERLIEEETPIVVLPFGDLPWPTKLGSSTTSLALLLNKGH